jgi:hypothetical protein
MNEKFGTIGPPADRFNAGHRLEQLRGKDVDDVLQLIYNWVQGNKISVKVFKFLLTETVKDKL